MRAVISILVVILTSSVLLASNDDYNSRQAKRYTQDAGYYQRKAEGYRREAAYYLRQAEGYQRDASYYTKKGDAERAKNYNRKANDAMDKYQTQIRYANKADDTAADYLRKAARLLSN
jgi:hypothetical protein